MDKPKRRRGRPKQEEEFLEEDGLEEDEEDGEDEDDKDEEDLPVMPLPPKRGRPKRISPENELEELEARIRKIKGEKAKEEFILDAPRRMQELERVVEENRKYIIALNNTINNLKNQINDQVAMLSK